MSLDVYLEVVKPTVIYSEKITHNLNAMAEAAGIYKHLWRPEELGITTAYQLIAPLKEGLKRLFGSPEEFRKYNPENGWGRYENLLEFVAKYLVACEENPGATVRACR